MSEHPPCSKCGAPTRECTSTGCPDRVCTMTGLHVEYCHGDRRQPGRDRRKRDEYAERQR